MHSESTQGIQQKICVSSDREQEANLGGQNIGTAICPIEEISPTKLREHGQTTKSCVHWIPYGCGSCLDTANRQVIPFQMKVPNIMLRQEDRGKLIQSVFSERGRKSITHPFCS